MELGTYAEGQAFHCQQIRWLCNHHPQMIEREERCEIAVLAEKSLDAEYLNVCSSLG